MLKTLYMVCCALLISTNAHGEESHEHTASVGFDRDTALGISQAAIGNQLHGFDLQKTNGRAASISDYRGKPLIISMIYTSCYHICPTTTKHLHQVVRKARAVLGTDSFNVLTIGFDVQKDTPQMMQFFADRQSISEANWYFMSADQATIDALAESLGFLYFASPNGFDHLIQATLLDGSGTVIRQVYGMDFDTPILVEPLKQLVFNGQAETNFFETLANQVKLFCTVYDPAQDKYRFDYSLFIGMFIGFLCVGLLGFQLIKEWHATLNA